MLLLFCWAVLEVVGIALHVYGESEVCVGVADVDLTGVSTPNHEGGSGIGDQNEASFQRGFLP